MRRLVILLLGMLPANRLKNLLLTRCGRDWRIDRAAVIQPCLLVGVGRLRVDADAGIGFGTVLRDVEAVVLEEGATLGQFNWVTGAARRVSPGQDHGVLTVRRRGSVTSRHYLDCAGGIEIGSYALVSGVRSTILTHGINVRTDTLELGPVRIGNYTLIGSAVVILKGAWITERCAVGAGSLVSKDLATPDMFYAGSPAVEHGPLAGALWFRRSWKHAREAPRDT